MNNKFKFLTDKINKDYRFIFIDVGAMGGIPRKWLSLMGNMDVIGFEPDPREFNKLVNTEHNRYFNYALNRKSEDTVYYITKSHGASSIFKPNMDNLSHYEDAERFHIVREEVMPLPKVKEFDSIMEENLINDADFIKIDTQGSELRILEGGQKRLIPKIFGLQIEVEFIEMYKNQPLFRHIDEFLNSKGFMLIDLRRQYWKRRDYYGYRGKGQLAFGDALYFKRIDVFYNEISLSKDLTYARAKIIKSILACLVYKIFDYAVAVTKSGLEHGYLANDECTGIISMIKKYSRRGIPLIMHLGKIYSVLNLILQNFKPPSYLGWVDSDAELGNVKDV